MAGFTVVRSEERDRWRDAAVDSRQSFPATGNFDLEANAFGLLLVHNDDTVSPGEGFDMHFHKDVEIVTWVIEGAVHHRDSGSEGITEVRAGMAQHISAGSGVRHSEVNAGGYTSGRRLRVVQSWLPADVPGTAPSHASHDFSDRRGLTQVAGPDSPLPLGTAGAAMYVARAPVTIPVAAFVHLYVIEGRIDAAGHPLESGDVLRATDAEDVEVRGEGEILVWVMERGVDKP
ncbi:pirin family protein [Corynebacterium sp.]|uniref:pirin family protein n=1 Tax=Corynebacterium sp. TaxID=1720 RepID=UPI0026DF2571|nr:pirin family protein [Corynebacterium sp.]MDO5512572.1 pirin family protein [Corynebacterium sp.]